MAEAANRPVPRLPSPSPPPADSTPGCVADLRRFERFMNDLGRDYKDLRAAPNATRRVRKLYAWIKEYAETEAGVKVYDFLTWDNDEVDDVCDIPPNWRLSYNDNYDRIAGFLMSMDIGGIFTVVFNVMLRETRLEAYLGRIITADFFVLDCTKTSKLDTFSWSYAEICGEGENIALTSNFDDACARLRLMDAAFARVGAVMNVDDMIDYLHGPPSSDDDDAGPAPQE